MHLRTPAALAVLLAALWLTAVSLGVPGAIGEWSSASREPASGAADGVPRLAGPDRFSTAAEIAGTYPPDVAVAYVASGASFPDALAGAALAGSTGGPLLLTRPDALPGPTAAQLGRLAPRRIVVLGGESAVRPAVLGELRRIATADTDDEVTRLAGPDRYATAAAVAATYPRGVDVAYVATGTAFPDALAGAALAGKSDAPLVLTGPGGLPAASAEALTRLAPQRIVVVGGSAAVSDTTLRTLRGFAAANTPDEVTRLSGGDRFSTAAAVAATYPRGVDVAYVATGSAFPDALAGAALAGTRGSPVLLTRSDELPGATRTALDGLAPAGLVILGAEDVVDSAVAAELAPYHPRPEAAPRELSPPAQAVTRAGGALPVGSTTYPVPSGAVFVATTGDDDAAGTAAAPLRTLTAALDSVRVGGTVVLRGGTYHEQVTVTRRVTIQGYPGEAVWFDGSVPVTGFTAEGGAWVRTGWTTEFDASPTYTWGAEDGTDPGWGFVDPDRPMAAHPDQVWVDGIAQYQVGTLAEVGPGTFYVDHPHDRLYLGTDPAGRAVRASVLARAMELRAEGVTLRGVGVRRYAPSVPHMGTVTAEAPGVRIENVHVTDNATTGLSATARDITVEQVTLARNGMLGMHASQADDLTVAALLCTDNNTERFNTSPVAGGMKVGRLRGITVSGSTFADNHGTGLWLDESVYDGRLVNNVLARNAGHGMALEISAKVLVAGNAIVDNARFGIKVNNTSDVGIWNNTVVGNDRAVNIVQDPRRASDPSTPGHDPRRQHPDPAMTWLTGPVTVVNTILSADRGNCLLCVEDYSAERSAEEMGISADGNVYHQAEVGSPRWVAVWSRGARNPSVFPTLGAFQQATGQDTRSRSVIGRPAVTAAGRVVTDLRDAAPDVALPLPSEVAAAVGVPTGTRQLGRLD